MTKRELTPLKITVQLTNFAIPERPIHFDDLLAFATVAEYKATNKKTEAVIYDDLIRELPLEKVTINEDWIWKSSAFRWLEMRGKYMRPISKRVDVDTMASLKSNGTYATQAKQIRQGSGIFKSSIGLMPVCAHAIGEAYCVGEKARIEHLLKQITFVGKKHQRGQGVVRQWLVEEAAKSTDKWRYRHLPISFDQFLTKEHALAANIAVRSPYWLGQRDIAYGLTF